MVFLLIILTVILSEPHEIMQQKYEQEQYARKFLYKSLLKSTLL